MEGMKVTTPQIVWHSKEPVFSADFHRNGAAWRLVTGGADKDIKVSFSCCSKSLHVHVPCNVRMLSRDLACHQVWKVVQEEGKVKVKFMASLARHSGAVNVVRFSPNGKIPPRSCDQMLMT